MAVGGLHFIAKTLPSFNCFHDIFSSSSEPQLYRVVEDLTDEIPRSMHRRARVLAIKLEADISQSCRS